MFGQKIITKFKTKDNEIMEIVLRPPVNESEDGKKLAEWLNDGETAQFLGSSQGNTSSTEDEWLRASGSNKENLVWMIYIDGTMIGDVDLHRINYVDRHAEIGLLIGDKNFWRKGLATAIEVTILEYSFQNVTGGGLNKITAGVFKDNVASKRAVEKIGFHQAGLIRDEIWRNGRWHDVYIFEMLAGEWAKKRESAMETARIVEIDLCPGVAK